MLWDKRWRGVTVAAVAVATAAAALAACRKKTYEDNLVPGWYERRDELRGRPDVKEATLGMTGAHTMLFQIELDYKKIVAAGEERFDTGITPEMCEGQPFPVELRIRVPDYDGRSWQGFYSAKRHAFVTFSGYPPLEPKFDPKTGTFVVHFAPRE